MAIPMQDNTALLQTLLGTVTGGKTTTGGSGTSSSTTKTDITQEGILRIIENYLGQNGMAEVRTGDARTGLNRSSSKTLAENDLLVRAAGEAARLSAPTTTNQSRAESGVTNKEAASQNVDWGTLLGIGGLGALGKIFGPTVGGAVDKIPGANGQGLDGIGKSLADLLLGGGNSSGNFAEFFPQNNEAVSSPISSGSLPEGQDLPAFSEEDYVDLSDWWDNFMNESFDMSD